MAPSALPSAASVSPDVSVSPDDDSESALPTVKSEVTAFLVKEAGKESLLRNILMSNAEAAFGAFVSCWTTVALFGLMRALPGDDFNQEALGVFLHLTLLLITVLHLRWEEDEIRRNSILQFPASIALAALTIVLFEGDTGNATMPLVVVVHSLAMSTSWLVMPVKPNIVNLFLGYFPVSIVMVLVSMIPA